MAFLAGVFSRPGPGRRHPRLALVLVVLAGFMAAPATGAMAPVRVGAARVTGLEWQAAPGGAMLIISVAGRPGLAVTAPAAGRLAVDLVGASPAAGLTVPVPAGEGGVRQIGIRHHPGHPGFTRVTLDLDTAVNHQVRYDRAAAAVVVDIGYQVTRVTHAGEGVDARVRVETNGPLSFRMLTLAGESRMVLDLPGATLSPGQPPGTYPAGGSPVRQLHVVELPAGVRVMADLAPGASPHVVADHHGFEVAFAPRVRAVILATSVWGTPRLLVYTSAPVTVREAVDLNPQRLVLDLAGAVLAEGVPPAVTGDGSIEAIRISRLGDEDPGVRLVADLLQYGSHTLAWNQQGTLLTVDFHPPDLRGFIVVLDAGHGGHDPGAVSIRAGIREKDMTLDLALRVGARLEEAGATVIQTRDSDVFVSNEARVLLANRAGAHVLVSIHLNAYRDSSVRGLETYRHRSNPGGTELAEHLQAAILEHTGLPDRGLRWENFVVLRDAVMPSVMVEVCYLTNPLDAALIADPAFRDWVADGIFQGLLHYFTARRLRSSGGNAGLPPGGTLGPWTPAAGSSPWPFTSNGEPSSSPWARHWSVLTGSGVSPYTGLMTTTGFPN